MEITPFFTISGQIFLAYFEGYLEFFAVLQYFIDLFHDLSTEPLMMFFRTVGIRGTLFGKYWPKE